MRRAVSRLAGLAGQAAAPYAWLTEATIDNAALRHSRAAWLLPPRRLSAAATGAPAAAQGAACLQHAQELRGGDARLTRGIASSSRAQHEAAAAARQGAAAAAEAQERTCWQCGTRLSPAALFFCPECESVQPPAPEVDYFPVFGMEEGAFDLDVAELERRYKALQLRLHPDRFGTASPLEREHAAQQAAAVNQAYDVLKRPLRRAHYILNQRGFGACEGMTITDPELLMYVMEAREDVEGTPPQDKGRLQQLLDANNALEGRCIEDLKAAFADGDLQHAAELTTQLRYICRIREAIVDKM